MRAPTILLSVLLALPLCAASDPDQQYRFVLGLSDKGLHEEVVREARAFLAEHARDPHADQVRYRLGAALFELGQTAEAAGAFAPLCEREGFELRSEARLRLGQCQLAEGDARAASGTLERLLKDGAGYLEVPAALVAADAWLEQGDHARARTRYAAVLASGKPEHDADARCGLAWSARGAGDARATIEAARGFLERHARDPRAGELRFLLGDALLAAGELEAAVRELGLASAADGAWSAAAGTALGHAHAAAGRHADAAQAFARVLARTSDPALARECRLHAGVALARLERFDEAAAALAHETLAADPEAQAWLAEALTRLGRDADALAVLERGLSLEPSPELEARLWAARGDRLAALGRDDEAVRAWRRAGSQRSVYNAAATSLNEGDARAAETLARELIEAAPDAARRAQAELLLGEALFAQQDYAGAERAFGAGLAPSGAAPDLADEAAARAASRIAWCRWFAGDAAGAASRFGALAKDASGELAAEAAFMQPRAELERGNRDAARTGFARYLERHPDGPHAAEALLCQARLATPAEACARLETLLARHGASPLAPLARFELAERLSAPEAAPASGARADGTNGAHAGGTNGAAADAGRPARLARADALYAELLADEAGTSAAGVDPLAARYGRAWCAFEAGRFAEARAGLEQLAARGPDAELARAAAELGLWSAAKEGDAEAFVRGWRTALAAGVPPERRQRVVASGAQLLLAQDRGDDARALFGSFADAPAAVRAAALIDLVSVELALARAADEPPERPARALEEALRLSAAGVDAAQAAFQVGEAWFERGAHDEALGAYRSAARLLAELPREASGTARAAELAQRVLYKQGFAALAAGDLATAEGAFAALLAAHEQSELAPESLFLLGETRFRAERYEDAARALADLLARAPRHAVAPKARFRLGQAQLRLGRHEAAAATLAELARTTPDFPNLAEAELERGRALVGARAGGEARRALARTLELDAGGVLEARARLVLGELARAEGDLDGALSEFLKVAVLFSGEEAAEALYRAGGVLEARDATERAREQYQELVAEHPGSAWAARGRERLVELGNR